MTGLNLLFLILSSIIHIGYYLGQSLKDYYDRKVIFWVDQEHFYPLRPESYDESGELTLVEERIGWHANPALGEQGCSKFVATYYDPRIDLMSYTLHNGPRLLDISAEEANLVFCLDFMRRN